MNTLLKIFKVSLPDSVQVTEVTVAFHGIDPGWAFLIGVAIVAATFWIYLRTTPALVRWQACVLATLRSLLIGLILILLMRPVLLLTVVGTIRRSLLVLVDASASMQIKDMRQDEADMKRVALAKEVFDPKKGLGQSLPKNTNDLTSLSRTDVLKAMLNNKRLRLLDNLAEHYDIIPYAFGQSLQTLSGGLTQEQSAAANAKSSSSDKIVPFWESISYDKPFTAIGDNVRSLLDLKRGQPLAGIFLITDGSNNYGSPPAEAAALAQQDKVPLYIYGVGITSPKDIIVSRVFAPDVIFAKEETPISVLVRSQSMQGRTTKITLTLGDEVVDTREITFGPDGEQNITLKCLPTKAGNFELEASIEPLADEAIKTNNKASQRLRVIDNKIQVLVIEQKPRWEFRYLQAMLVRDRRLVSKFVLLEGSTELSKEKDSPYLQAIPSTKEEWMHYDVIILGDIDPRFLPDAQLKNIGDMTSAFGGGLVVIAGKKFMPGAYRRTSLENLLPVEWENQPAAPANVAAPAKSIPLELTFSGQNSLMLRLAEKETENIDIWKHLPGVYWTFRVSRPKPAADVLLADPSKEMMNRFGPMPVMALQSYGAGQILYVGTDEIWRWRRNVGEKYYTRMWGQIILRLGLPRLLGASKLTQLVTDKKTYISSERMTISGRLYRSGFEPMTDSTVTGTLTIKPEQNTSASQADLSKTISLRATPGKPGFYEGETVVTTPGLYAFSTQNDPGTSLDFRVIQPILEFGETALNLPLLKKMAETSGGELYREEDLYKMPDALGVKMDKVPSPMEVECLFSPIYFAMIFLLATAEWLLRKRWKLK